jgi:hypothetical protein
MGDIVNLNRFRKARAKAEQVRQAEENRRLHGRDKAEKRRGTKEKARAERDLEGKKLT